jgi:hypothetical protein
VGGSNRNAECCHSPSDLTTVSVSRCGDCAASPFLCGKEIFFTHSKFIGGWPGSLPFCFAPTEPKGMVCSLSACNKTANQERV